MKKYVSNERSSAIICVNVNPHQPNARLAAARGFSLLAAKHSMNTVNLKMFITR